MRYEKYLMSGCVIILILASINIDLSLDKNYRIIHSLNFTDIEAFSDTAKTIESCLKVKRAINGRKRASSVISNHYCYQKRDKQPDIFWGEVVECIPDSLYKGIPCIPLACSDDTTCYASNRRPVKANFVKP
jgi:hypothetical protein